MAQQHTIQVIAHIRSDFHTKFGIPRQSGLVDALRATVVFEPEYRNPDALRGLEGFSHIWLIWQFSQAVRDGWSPTVRPPRLGGNARMGVFATRSPFRPNPIGLSCVALEGIQRHPEYGPVLLVRGADLMDGTPIYDVKPYLPYARLPPGRRRGLCQPAQGAHPPGGDCPGAPGPGARGAAGGPAGGAGPGPPAPQYQHRPDRVYGLEFGPLEVKFTVEGELLTVRQVQDRRRGVAPGGEGSRAPSLPPRRAPLPRLHSGGFCSAEVFFTDTDEEAVRSADGLFLLLSAPPCPWTGMVRSLCAPKSFSLLRRDIQVLQLPEGARLDLDAGRPQFPQDGPSPLVAGEGVQLWKQRPGEKGGTAHPLPKGGGAPRHAGPGRVHQPQEGCPPPARAGRPRRKRGSPPRLRAAGRPGRPGWCGRGPRVLWGLSTARPPAARAASRIWG